MNEENVWTDRQKEEYNRLVDEYYEHPICGKCGKPLDKGALSKDDAVSSCAGVSLRICCPACGPLFVCSWGDMALAFAALEGDPIQKNMDMIWRNYADFLAKKAHPDWWDFAAMLPVRRDIE